MKPQQGLWSKIQQKLKIFKPALQGNIDAEGMEEIDPVPTRVLLESLAQPTIEQKIMDMLKRSEMERNNIGLDIDGDADFDEADMSTELYPFEATYDAITQAEEEVAKWEQLKKEAESKLAADKLALIKKQKEAKLTSQPPKEDSLIDGDDQRVSPRQEERSK